MCVQRSLADMQMSKRKKLTTLLIAVNCHQQHITVYSTSSQTCLYVCMRVHMCVLVRASAVETGGQPGVLFLRFCLLSFTFWPGTNQVG